MAHCRIPVIDHITIDNAGGDVHSAVVELDVVSAEGSHGGPREFHLDLAAHKPTILRNVDLKLDPSSMLAVDELRPGDIRVVLRDAEGTVLAEAAKDVDILAANQWKASPPQLALEMLAAYVQPNAAVIARLLTEVSDRLREVTGNSAIDGYQSENPARVDAIAQAVFDAMRARDIRYAEPPASWGNDGQKVRTPAEVLEGRLGTCLDTTLVMAAALEQAGVNSTIWVLKGHAFLGYWRTDSALSMITTTEPIDVVNQVDLGNIRLVETTMVTQASVEATFADAIAAPRVRYLSAGLEEIIGVTDVRQAREAQIYPLPSRAVDAEGNVVVTRYEPGAGRAIAPYVGSGKSEPTAAVEGVPARIGQWKNALLDLSLRNKLINYTDRAGFRVDVPGPALGRFEDAISAQARITLLPSDEVKSVDVARGIRFGRDLPERERELLLADKHSAYVDVTQATYKTKLRHLAYKAKTILEETGANNLYLAFGMLNWHFNDRELRSPLVLVPVTLTTANRGERYNLVIDEAGASTPNYCLIEKLRVELGLEIPGLANPSEDASGIDLAETFDAVRRAIADAELRFRVEETVHLSILQFAKFPLWKDLDESWKELTRNSLVKHLVETPKEQFVDPVAEVPENDLDELGTAVPVPADSSQLRAVSDAVGGKTFVLEGPPGTGKSQTITNLLAHAMASGRRVLFVAEKRAALDVVKKRLEAVGLGELSLDLHDKSARPAAVRAQIKDALELRVSSDPELLKTNLQAAEASRGQLARYAARLHEANAAGLSLYTARGHELAADQDVAPLDVPRELVANGTAESFDVIGQVLRSLPAKVDLARPRRDHPWGFIDAVPATGLDPSEIHAAAVEFDSALEEVQRSGLSIDRLSVASDAAAIAFWAQLADEPRFTLDAVDAMHAPHGQAQRQAIMQILSTLSGAQPAWLASVKAGAMDLDIPVIHQAAVAADESGFFGRKKRRREVLAQLTDVLAIDPATVKLKELSTLTKGIADTYAVVSDLRSRVANLPVQLFDRPCNPLVVEDASYLSNQLETLRRLGDALSSNPGDPFIADVREYYRSTAHGAVARPLARLAAAWQRLGQNTGVTPTQRLAWAGEGTFMGQWWATRADRRLETIASIERWVDLVTHVEPLLPVGLAKARSEILRGSVIAEDASLAFDRGTAIASIAERLDASALSDFDVTAHGKTIRRFAASANTIRGELHRAIPAQLLGTRRFDAEASSGQVGGLRRQLDRKRGGMSVRQLMENYGELITQILPCTLMSPDSVARFFPARPDTFDVVVFDEASQIRVADAVGSMGRAKSVVVVGDSKQMPPTSFAESSAAVDEDDEYNPDTVIDEESILTECVQALVPQQWLSWHYRSQDEELIAFSNVQYYGGKLASFPAPLPPASGHGVSLVRVDGQFDRAGKGKTLRTNRAEADSIVADIRRRFAASPDVAPSLGVITFNAPQRNLIENLLRDAGDDRLLRALDEPDGLFVKNLENVQGDERDTILFSVAFSKNDKGVVPLNFGPLSRPGGERRLNVAITRARREVVLYASFDPSELRAEETFQIGTKHLKEYLELAARGVETITEGGRRQPVTDRHRDDIAEALRKDGLTVSTDVGLSDFRVDIVIADPEKPEQPLVAVLLDGLEWFGRPTVADRDGLPLDVLANLMHWPAVERVWMPEWLNHRADTIARLRAAVVEAKERLERPPVEPDPVIRIETPKAPVLEPQKIAMLRGTSISAPVAEPKPRAHPNVKPHQEWVPTRVGDKSVLDELWYESSQARVIGVIRAVIEAEAPIQGERLAKLVASGFGLGRVNEDRRRSILQLVPREYGRQGGEGFYWPAGVDPESWRLVRRPREGVSRPLDEISLVEIGNAMLVVAEQAGGISPEELKRDALNLFGGKRITPAIGSRLEDALKGALAKGVLREDGSGLVINAAGSWASPATYLLWFGFVANTLESGM
jgi:SpoU rRNA methylase family enzyme